MTKQRAKASLLGIVIFLWGATLFAHPDTLWTKTFGGLEDDEARSVCETSDGGYIIAGFTESFGEGSSDFYLIRTDSEGNSLWTKTYGGEYRDGGRSVCLTSDGGYIIAGFTESFGTGEGSVYLIKTDADGDSLWTKTYGGSDYAGGHYVQQTSDSGYIIAGQIGLFDAYLVKTDADGDTLWTKKYGGVDYDVAHCVCETSDGGYIITGSTESFGAGGDDVWLLKTDEYGDTMWTRTYGGEDYEIGWSVCETSDGGYVIAGWTESFAVGFWDVYLIKTDADGDTMWTKTYGGMHIDVSISVQETPAGGYILAGHTYLSDEGDEHSDIYLIRTDTNGDSLWSRTWGGTSNEYGLSVGLTSDGGYIVAGSTQSFGAGERDVWLLKIAPDVGIEERPPLETSITAEVIPNPFAHNTTVRYSLPQSSPVAIEVYDPIGRKVRMLLDSPQSPGAHTVTWDGTDEEGRKLSSGLYFIRIATPRFSQTAKVIMVR